LWWTAWILKAEDFAYSELGLREHEFWDMTILEFENLRAGFYRRRRRELELQATWITVLVNAYPMRGKNAKTLRVEQLIGESPDKMAKMIRERDRIRRKRQREAEEAAEES
jgi:hypothetical protein